MEQQSSQKFAMHVSIVSIIWNVGLSAFKLFAGIVANSGAMVSDAVHSASDVFSTFVVMAGVKMAGKASDPEHPYGHERLECVAAIILSGALLATGLMIGWQSLLKISAGEWDTLEIPGALALVAAIASIVIKEAMYWYTRNAAKKINSSAVMADAWHHRSDALSSIGSFVGIFGARLGFPVLDPMAGFVICIFIVKAAYDIFRDAINKMTDKACDESVQRELVELAAAQEGVQRVDYIRSRLFGDRMYLDVEICADGALTLYAAHDIAQAVHDAIEQQFPLVKHCMVHINPLLPHPPALTTPSTSSEDAPVTESPKDAPTAESPNKKPDDPEH